MAEALFDKAALWLAGEGPEVGLAMASECSLVRNLSDVPFPARCSDEERHSVETRVLAVLESANLLAAGQYYPLAAAAPQVPRLLAERRLVAFDLVRDNARGGARLEGPRGAYVADDQSMSVMVNTEDHVCIRVLAAGLQLQEAWARANLLEDALAEGLDFAFDHRYGYLTSHLGQVGTGLKVRVILHLPGLGMTTRVMDLAQAAKDRRLALHGLKPTVFTVTQEVRPAPDSGHTSSRSVPASRTVSEAIYGDLYGTLDAEVSEAVGDLYVLSNAASLGASEEEFVFHTRHLAMEILEEERRARQALMENNRLWLEDRVARALAVARSARLLGFTEALSLLSSIRLGIDTGLLEGYSLQQLNDLLVASQSVHLEVGGGLDGHPAEGVPADECVPADEWALSLRRADLFRSRLS